MRLAALAALGAVGTVLCAGAAVLTLHSDHTDTPLLDAVLGATVTLSFLGTGLFAWWRRPSSRFGALMTAVGFAFLACALMAANASLPFTLGIVLSPLYVVLAAHMLLAYPSGRLETRLQRRVIGLAYGVAIASNVGFVLFSPDFGYAGAYPANAFLLADVPAAVTAVDIIGNGLGVALAATIVALLVARWRGAGAHARRRLGPLLWTGAAMIVLLTLNLLLQPALGWEDPVLEALRLPLMLAFAAMPWAFLAGLLRGHYASAAAVGALVQRLAGARADVRGALAEALGDPSVEVAYWLADQNRYVDLEGRTVELPAAGRARAATEVHRAGQRVAAIVHDPSLTHEGELVRAAGAAASLALDNERLRAELRARVEELEDSRRRLVEASLAERRRLERDLHDGAQQRLVALSVQLSLARTALERDPAGAGDLLEGARDELRHALEELRELARGIHPAVLTDRGLDAAMEALAARSPVAVRVVGLPEERLPPTVEAAAYFIVAESLTNVAKYARAREATVQVAREDGRAIVEVRDDGVGGADPVRGSGLRGLADRLAALDGRLEIVSPPGEGTTVRATVPCASS